MNCLKCRAPIDLGAKSCAGCGAPLDADGDGVPDVLAKMVEDKARGLLAAERAAAAAEAERKAAEERAVLSAKELAQDRRTLVELRELREAHALKKPKVWHSNAAITFLFGVIAIVLGGVLFPACVEPMAGRTVLAGPLFCSSVCASCRGPGRVFTWHTSGGGYEGNVSAQLCHNDAIDVEKLTWQDVNDDDDPKVKPYRLSMWASVPLDFVLVFALLSIFAPFLLGRFRTKELVKVAAELDARIDHLERKLAAPPPVPGGGAYRT